MRSISPPQVPAQGRVRGKGEGKGGEGRKEVIKPIYTTNNFITQHPNLNHKQKPSDAISTN